jgi:hypothetical protein
MERLLIQPHLAAIPFSTPATLLHDHGTQTLQTTAVKANRITIPLAVLENTNSNRAIPSAT